MDSFEWHEAETSLIRATAARLIYENPGTDLSVARQVPVPTRSSDRSPQPEVEFQEPTLIDTTQRRELTPNSSKDTATSNTGEAHHDLPLRKAQQTISAQSMDNQSALQTSTQHETVAPEQSSQNKFTASAGTRAAERDSDDEKNENNTISEQAKAQLPPCDTCQQKHAKCSRAWPRCRRCKQHKEKCIYSQENYADGLKRLGRGLACYECGRKGRKCSGERPECGSCRRLGIECVYKDLEMKELAMGERVL